jgi:phosphatidylinositol alpha-1,6-mannosyltransferase
VEHGRTGLLVDGASPSEVADALVSLLSDPDLARRLGHAGREHVERHGSWARAGAVFRAVCGEVAGTSLR